MKKLIHHLIIMLLLVPGLLSGQAINVDLQNVTYDDVSNQICFDVYMGQGTGYPGGWTGMNLRYDLDIAIASGTPSLGAPLFTNVNSTYIDNPPAGSGTQPGSPPVDYEFEYGFGISRLGGQGDLPVSLTLMFSVCIPVQNGTLDGSDPGNDVQMRAATTISGSSWSGSNTVGRQPFNAQDAMEPLPIELLLFELRGAGCEMELYWETARERNLAYYEIELSKDGRVFSGVWQHKPASPNSTSRRAYRYAIPREYQDQYLRMKAVDMDGVYEYSEVIYVKSRCEDKEYELHLYPNPNYTTELVVELKSAQAVEKVELQLLDAYGKLLRKQKVEQVEVGINKISMETADLPTGTYFIKILGIDQLQSPLKFIRSNF